MDEDKKCGLNYAVDLITKNRFDTNVLDELIISEKGVDVLTGNTSLHYCQNVLKEEYYDKILTSAKEKYDFIIIDTSSNVFLDSTKWALQIATKILFVTENTYVCLKKSTQLLNVLINVWRIWKSKINLIVVRRENNGLEIELMQKIMDNIAVVGSIKNNDNIEYEKILSKINFVPKKSLGEKVGKVTNYLKDKFNKNKIPITEVQHAN